jgi:hypothetical protein
MLTVTVHCTLPVAGSRTTTAGRDERLLSLPAMTSVLLSSDGDELMREVGVLVHQAVIWSLLQPAACRSPALIPAHIPLMMDMTGSSSTEWRRQVKLSHADNAHTSGERGNRMPDETHHCAVPAALAAVHSSTSSAVHAPFGGATDSKASNERAQPEQGTAQSIEPLLTLIAESVPDLPLSSTASPRRNSTCLVPPA